MPDLSQSHRQLLERRRHVMNLVGPGPIEPHFEDCERALTGLEPTGQWVDLGSGAGFPGLVFAARYPEVAIDLVERRRKRATFLSQVLLEAEVDSERVRVLPVPAEKLEPTSYDGVLARAFAPPEVVLQHGQRLLRAGGTVVLFLQEHGVVPEDPAFEVFHVEHYAVDGRSRKAVALRLR